MADNYSRQRAKNIIGMVTIPRQTNQSTSKSKSIIQKKNSLESVPDDYINNLYTRPYSMTSSVFQTFCETKISNTSYHLSDLLNYPNLNESFSGEKAGDKNKENLENYTSEDETLTANSNNLSVDLTCKEVMPLEESLFENDTVPCNDNSRTENSKHRSLQTSNIDFDFDSDDSVRDKDYQPSDTSSDESIDRPLEMRQKKQKSQIDLITKKTGSSSATSKNYLDTVSQAEKERKLHRRNSTDCMQSVKISAPTLIRKRRNTNIGIYQTLPSCNTVTHCSEPEITQPQRKRKKYNTSALQRKIEARDKRKSEHCLKTGCNERCLKKCTSRVDHATNKIYWDMNSQEQHVFVNSHTSVAIPKRKTTSEPKRNPKRSFFFKQKDGTIVEVCKIFFLTTLGYTKTNDRILHDTRADPTVDKRGKHQKTPAYDRNLLTQHVESFNPLEPHYRREHAPLRRYLPSDISVVHMHKHFCEKYPEKQVSYELYRQHLKKMNISFTRLGNEECEVCEAYNLHKKETSHQTKDCIVCEEWAKHHDRYLKARKLYDEHKKIPQDNSAIYFSADLEKVIMLPRLESFKTAIFCQRLVAYNQTFAPLGKITSESKPLTVLWNDSIAGRKQEDIMTAFYHFLLRHRDVANIHVWLDNCSAQNKNWLLYSLLIHLINSEDISTEKIILYYFEPGHTFMSSDQVHHQVELAMKKKGKLYDFTDFEDAVASINNSKVVVKSLAPENFLNVPNYISDRRIQNSNPRAYLKNMTEVCFARKKYEMLYKNSYDEEYSVLRFMNDKYLKNPNVMKLEFRSNPKGVEYKRKVGILEKLSHIIPPHKLLFWKNLPTNNNDEDASTSSSKNTRRL